MDSPRRLDYLGMLEDLLWAQAKKGFYPIQRHDRWYLAYTEGRPVWKEFRLQKSPPAADEFFPGSYAVEETFLRQEVVFRKRVLSVYVLEGEE